MSAPPPESLPGFNDDRGPSFRAFIVTLFVSAWISTTLRFWSRSLPSTEGRPRNRFWWDDWVALAAVLALTAQSTITLILINNGLGRHLWVLSEQQVINVLRLLHVVYYIYDLVLTLTRASALLFFTRVFANHHEWDWFNIGVLITHGLNAGWLIGIVFGTAFLCQPFEKNWMPLVPGNCGSTNQLYLGSAVPSVTIDLIILVLPLPKIWGLQITSARKVGLSFIFLLGYGVIVAALGRLITIFTEAEALATDITHGGINVFYWTCAEGPISVLGINLPALLRLGSWLSVNYYKPLLSKTSMLTSRLTGRQTTELNESFGNSKSSGMRLELSGQSQRYQRTDSMSNDDLGRLSSNDSKQMIDLADPQRAYSAQVRSESSERYDMATLPASHILVENDVTVSRQGQGQARRFP